MEEFVHKRCRELVAQKLGRGNSEHWIDQDYKVLREEIHKETNILISVNTLKRYFGKVNTSGNYDPQRETKNALAQYIGFQDWYSFEDQEITETGKIESLRPQPERRWTNSGKKVEGKPAVLIVAIVTIALLGFAAVFFWSSNDEKVPKWTFSILNPVDTAPFTLYTKFKLEESEQDSFSIDGFTKMNLKQKDSILSTYVSSPIYTWLILKYKNKELKKIPFHALSRGWETFFQQTIGKNRSFVEPAFVLDANGIGIKKEWFINNRGDSSSFAQQISNFKNFDLEGDYFSCEFEASVYGRPELCNFVGIRFFGAYKHLEYRITSKGCAHFNYVNLSELYLDGINNEFSKIHIFKNQRVKTRLECKNKQVSLFINGIQVFSGAYKSPVGKIKGISVQFNGFGKFHAFKAWNEKGSLVENEEFGK